MKKTNIRCHNLTHESDETMTDEMMANIVITSKIRIHPNIFCMIRYIVCDLCHSFVTLLCCMIF